MTKTGFTSFDLGGDEPLEMTWNEIKALKQMTQLISEQPIIVNIGAGMGCSTLAMLEERPQAFIVSVDTDERCDERKYVEKAGLDYRRVIRILGKSQDIGLYWPFKCELLYIDGDHRRPYIDYDIWLWAKQVSTGGVIAFHDCILPQDKPEHIQSEVYEAVEDWLQDKPREEILWVERVRGFRV